MNKPPHQSRRSLTTIALVCAVIVIFYLNQKHAEINEEPSHATVENIVDTYTVEVSSQQFNEKGQIKSVMKANNAAHYRNSDESILNEPSITSFSDTGHIWQTSAKYGKVRAGGSQYELWTDVKIERIDGHAVVTTNKLTFDSNSEIATTNEAVIMVADMGETRGVGMSADLNSEILTLHSSVKGLYKPPLTKH